MAQDYGGAGDPAPNSIARLRAKPVKPIPIPATSTDALALNRPALLMGWSLRETTGAAVAAVRLFSGTTAGGQLVASIALASGGSSDHATSDDGVFVTGGLFLDVVAGSVEGAIYARY